MRTKSEFACEKEIRRYDLDDFIASRVATVPEEGLQSVLNGCLKKFPRDRLKTRCLLDQPFLQTGTFQIGGQLI